MCPDSELLSAYYDEELDHLWEARVAAHVTECQACQARLSRFARLSEELRLLEEPDFAASMERSWQLIQDAQPTKIVPIWNRRIAVPVPLLAAAAALLIAVFGVGIYLNFFGVARQAPPVVAIQQPEIAPVDFQVSNLNDLLSYLNSKDLGTSITIQLPKGVDQLSVGKPQLIRAADFNRGQ